MPFWRWQPEVPQDMREGTKLLVMKDKLPNYRRQQQVPSEPGIFEKVKEKIQKVRMRGYIALSIVLILIGFFHVPKGEDDIHMVYNATACGLNEAL